MIITNPLDTKRHETSFCEGHIGNLAIFVGAEGNLSQLVLAPRLKATDMIDRSLMGHVGRDNSRGSTRSP